MTLSTQYQHDRKICKNFSGKMGLVNVILATKWIQSLQIRNLTSFIWLIVCGPIIFNQQWENKKRQETHTYIFNHTHYLCNTNLYWIEHLSVDLCDDSFLLPTQDTFDLLLVHSMLPRRNHCVLLTQVDSHQCQETGYAKRWDKITGYAERWDKIPRLPGYQVQLEGKKGPAKIGP